MDNKIISATLILIVLITIFGVLFILTVPKIIDYVIPSSIETKVCVFTSDYCYQCIVDSNRIDKIPCNNVVIFKLRIGDSNRYAEIYNVTSVPFYIIFENDKQTLRTAYIDDVFEYFSGCSGEDCCG